MKFQKISWQNLHHYSFQIFKKIRKEKIKVDLIVAVARGGLNVAQTLSDFLKLPVAVITISSYHFLRQTKKPKLFFSIKENIAGKNILLVDDISDNGKTFITAIKYLKEEKRVKNIKTASIFIKIWTKFIPDFYAQKTEKWIVWPFDVRETIEALGKNNNSKIINTLQFPTEMVEAFKK